MKKLLTAAVSFLLRSAVMFFFLCAVDTAASITGFSLGVSPLAILSGGLFGLPGVGLVLAAKMICG